MERTTSTLALLATGALVVSGCAAPQRTATTNTTRIINAPYSVTFDKAQYDTVSADGRDFVLTERDLGFNVMKEGTLHQVLDDQMVPLDNSLMFRRPGHVNFIPKTERYFLVNGFYDEAKKLHINNEAEEKSSYFVLEKRTFTEQPSAERLEEIQKAVMNRVMDEDRKTNPGAKFRDTRYITVPVDNEFGPDKVFIDRTTVDSLIMKDSTRADDGTVTIVYRFGVVGKGYIPTTGTQVAKPEPPKPEGPRVIEGMPNPTKN